MGTTILDQSVKQFEQNILFAGNHQVGYRRVALSRLWPEVVRLINRLGPPDDDQWPRGAERPRFANRVISPLRMNLHAGYQQHLKLTAVEPRLTRFEVGIPKLKNSPRSRESSLMQ